MSHDAKEGFIPYSLPRLTPEEMVAQSLAFYHEMDTRRSARIFSPEPIPLEAVRQCIDVACTAPSGAHKQPWTFCLVTNPELRKDIRRAAEEVIGLQVDAGVDVPTDGEVRRENYIHYHCRHITGFDFRDLNAACCAMAPMRRNFRQSEGRSRMTVRPTARTILQPARRSARGR